MKTFIVKLKYSDRNPEIITIAAQDFSDATKIINSLKKRRSTLVYTKIKETINCFVESAFGHIHINVEPNPYYDTEIIINGVRFALHMPINYWNIKSISFNSVQNNSMAVVCTEKEVYLVRIDNTSSSSRALELIRELK